MKNSYEMLEEINKKAKMTKKEKFIIGGYVLIFILCIVKVFISPEEENAWLVSAILAIDCIITYTSSIKIAKKYEVTLGLNKDLIFAINDVMTKKGEK